MRGDVQAVLDRWAELDGREARRLRSLREVEQLAEVVKPEAVTWFQSVEWWTAPEPAGPGRVPAAVGLFGEAVVPDRPAGTPDSGILVLTATRLVLIGARTRSEWALTAVAGFSFRAAQFVQSTPPRFEVLTAAGVQSLLPGRRAPHEPMLGQVRDALGRRRVGAEDPDAAARTAAMVQQLVELRERGTITADQFEQERRRLSG